jgi:hypothetical protein
MVMASSRKKVLHGFSWLNSPSVEAADADEYGILFSDSTSSDDVNDES